MKKNRVMVNLKKNPVIFLILLLFYSMVSLGQYSKAAKANFRYSELSLGTAKNLFVRSDISPSCLMSTTSVNSQIKKANLNIVFNWNTDFTASTTNQYTINYTIQGYSSFSGTTGLLMTYNASVVISNSQPQAFASIDFTGLYNTINRFVVTPVLTTSAINNTLVNGFVTSDVSYNEEFEYDVFGGTAALISAQPVSITGNNLMKFSWGPLCTVNGVPPNYQFQLLKLFNKSSVTQTDDRNMTADIDWDKALTIETGNSLMELSLTMAEGQGYYIWRVRPIGNAYEGGIANDRNWGQWTGTGSYVQGSSSVISTGVTPYLFYFSYNQFDFYSPSTAFNLNSYPGSSYTSVNDGNRNWIFKRNFVEGDQINNGQVNIGEAIGYANRLQMANQQQSRIISEKKKIISQSVYDYSGRSALNTLPTPVNKNTLSYEPSYVKNGSGLPYSASDFDYSFTFGTGTNNFKDPLPMDSTVSWNGIPSPSSYYSSNNDMEDQVPTAAGYPFTRTLFSKDGKNTAIESSMPGKDHRITSGVTKHTTRHMESGVADMELIRVFGDEAPDENSVYKTINIDPNNSASVAYISKEGKTIATCLSSPGATNLDPLASASSSPFSVSSTITSNNTSTGEYSFHAFKTLALTEQTNVTLTYNLTPNAYSDASCVTNCSTCDYKITLRVTGNNDEITPIVMSQVVAPTGCSPVAVNKSDVVTLPAGEYTIERIIESNTAPTSSSLTYINSFIQAAQTSLTNTLLNGTGTIVDDAGVPVSGAPSVVMQTILNYITANNLTALYSYLGVISTDTHKNVKIGCNTIRVPVWACTQHACSGNDLDFEAYLYNWFKISPTDNTAKLQKLQAMFPTQGYSLGDFNVVITNMWTVGGYTDCQKLWDCWQGTVALFAAQNNPNNPQPAVAVTIPGTSSTFSQGAPNYLDQFLNCTGYKIGGIKTIPGSGVGSESAGGYKTHPYKWFNYSSQCCTCELSFANSYVSCGQPVPSGFPGNLSTGSCGTLAAFITWFNASGTNNIGLPCGSTTSNNKEAFYKCILNNLNVSATGGISACANNSGLASSMQTGTSEQLVSACIQHCEGLYDQFVSSVIEGFHGQGMQVQGDVWSLVRNPLGVYEFGNSRYTPRSSDIALSKIYCQADALLQACKSNCSITVQSNGALGSAAEISTIQNLFTGKFVLASPVNQSCPEGYQKANEPSDSLIKSIMFILNNELIHQRQLAGSIGTWWNFYDFLISVAPSYASYFTSNTNVYVHPDIPSYFGIRAGNNRISYFFNTSKTGASTTAPKDIYSINSVSSSSNFIYSTTTTALVSTIISGSNPGYLFPTSFTPYISSSSVMILQVPVALLDAQTNGSSAVFPITAATSLNTYYNVIPADKGYWIYEVSDDITGPNELCNESICYKIQPVQPFEGQVTDFSPVSCETQTLKDISNSIDNQISNLVSDYGFKIRNIYKDQCITNLIDNYKADYSLKYHHYTLYYYDRIGNLLKTVPPAGVTVTSTTRLMHPAHAMITEYEYNSISQLVRQKTPDGGESKFWYDAKGKLRFSQNAKQIVSNKYSYTKYDALGRITEVGEFVSATLPDATTLNNLSYPTSGGIDITRTIYTTPASGIFYFGNKPQRFLQNRVSYYFSDRDGNTATTTDQVSTYYSYDPHGNVEWMIQDIPEIGRNFIAYEYDLISGSVIKVKYNEELSDRFYHRYTYDVDKRIKTAETSTDNIFWEKDASYNYYLHGPLKRTQIGQDGIQGLDYVYTINGWIKGMNGHTQSADPGGDGSLADNNMYVARDAYAMVLGYFANDFVSKTSVLNSSSALAINGIGLYNGNISSWAQSYDVNAMGSAIDYSANRTAKTFKYDELNRLTESKFNTQNATTLAWTNVTSYQENFSYDANGNIVSLIRNGKASNLLMDNLTYHYYTQAGGNYIPSLQAPAVSTNVTNRLAYVSDSYNTAAQSAAYTDDIENQTNTANYTYDQIGNLISDVSEGITAITWNVYGKIAQIQKTVGGVSSQITFLYDASGNRVYKKVEQISNPVLGDKTTYYVKDATGNSMAVYERTNTGTSPNYTATFTLKEQTLYGSDRLGNKNSNLARVVSFTSTVPPAAQVAPVAFHTSSYPYIMLPLANSTNKQVFSYDIYSNSSSSIILGTTEYLQSVSGASPTITYDQANSQAMAYDASGNVLLSAFAYKILTSSVVTGAQTVIYYKDTYKITNVPATLNNSPDAQAVFMKKPGTTDEYYLFSIGSDGKPYYHTVDASIGNLNDYNNLLDNNADYGKTMTVFEDRVGQGNSTLYLKRFYGGNSYLKMFSITASGITALPDVLIGGAKLESGEGEIQISPSGNRLAIASTNASDVGEIRLYNLSANHQSISSLVMQTFTGRGKSVEFSDNDVSVFYTAKSGTTTSLLRLPVATFATATPAVMRTQSPTNIAGFVRKGVNGKLYYAVNKTSDLTKFTLMMFVNPDAATTSLTTDISNLTNGSMPVQPHLLAYRVPATQVIATNRVLDKKEYELKDHLGNIHATFKDYKVRYATGSSDVVYEENFNAGTTGGFALTGGAASGSIVDNVNNSLRVYGINSSSGAIKTITLPNTLGGKYLLSFNYIPGNCSLAEYIVDGIGGVGYLYGGIQVDGRNDFVVTVPAGPATMDLKFYYMDPTSGHAFYIDDILVKKLDEPNATVSSTLLNETFATASNWEAANVNLTYTSGTLKISRAVASAGWYAASKPLNFIQDQLYKVSFDVANVSLLSPSPQTPGSNVLSFGFEGTEGTDWLDYSQPVANTATGSFVYYIVPKTSRGSLVFSIGNGGGGNFECELDNIKVEQVNSTFQPLYTAVLNTMSDQYAFGAIMPGRSFNSTNYKYGFNGKEKDSEIKGEGNSYDFGARIYDPRLGRWLSTDPLQAKYASLSPYNFAGNMPIIAIDPDGKVIKIVSTDPAFRLNAFTALQKLTNTKLVLLRDGTVQSANTIKTTDLLNVEFIGAVSTTNLVFRNNKPVGTKLVNDLIDDDNTVSIKEQAAGNGNETRSRGLDAYAKGEIVFDNNGNKHKGTGKGTDATIFYDPTEAGSSIVNDDGTTGRKPEFGLAHELGHARNMIKGLMSAILEKLIIDPDNGKKGKLTREEINNRNEVDIPVRIEGGSKARAKPKK